MTRLRPDQMPLMRPLPMAQTDTLRKWRLEEDYHLAHNGIILYAPKGFIFDGASIPRFFRRLYSPTGYLFLAGLFHDYCYQYTSYLESAGELWGSRSVDQKGADELFRSIANDYYPDHKIKTQVAYRALRLAGKFAWNAHRGKYVAAYDPTTTHVSDNPGE